METKKQVLGQEHPDTLNSCIGRFFKNTFGEPAYCFGRPHIDAILTLYEKLHKAIFGTKTDNARFEGT
ncbi:hypothetical protein F1880_000972 [Penicillium rolfsii]|nr:hypothetical protein F1880_000972 [Penicillium rolfsii]